MKNEKNKLTPQSIIYFHILYAIWTVVDYYSRLFGIDAGEEPTKIPVIYIERDGLIILRFRFLPYVTPNSYRYTLEEIRDIIQSYLQFCILPEETVLRPYMGGSTIYDIVEPLYINKVERTEKAWWIDVVYIDNPLSFKYVQDKKWKGDLLL